MAFIMPVYSKRYGAPMKHIKHTFCVGEVCVRCDTGLRAVCLKFKEGQFV
jgi:hypothetical protein